MAVLRVIEPFSYMESAVQPRVFAAGDLVDDKHPAVKRFKHFFEPVEETVARITDRTEPVVEQATAAPGEKRSVKKAAAASGETKSAPSSGD